MAKTLTRPRDLADPSMTRLEDPYDDSMRPFKLLEFPERSHGGRLGKLELPHRHAIETPHYLAITSRGAVPHLSQDNMRRHSNIKATYLGLEDFVENAPRRTPPLFQQPVKNGESPLKKFTTLPRDTVAVLAPRRMPPVNPPNLNRKSEQAPNRSIIISTSVGFQILDVDEFINDAQKLSPDLVIGLSDNVVGEAPGKRRAEKMVDRTAAWTRKLLQSIATPGDPGSSTASYALAPILPLSVAAQSQYLAQLEDEMDNRLCGFALYDTACLPDLPERLYSGVRLSLDEVSTPHKVLDEVAMGVDLFVFPLVGAATDAGLALDFAFPAVQAPIDGPSEQSSERQPLAIDLWTKDHATDLGPLRKGCSCFACGTHHRAYVHHLLDAKEMLAWVLLQIHNHHIIDAFFSGIRESISRDSFEHDVENFNKIYESEMPEKTGQGPRVRGYQMRSEEPGEKKKNPSRYNTLDDIRQKIADAPSEPDATMKATSLENQGLVVTRESKTSIGDELDK